MKGTRTVVEPRLRIVFFTLFIVAIMRIHCKFTNQQCHCDRDGSAVWIECLLYRVTQEGGEHLSLIGPLFYLSRFNDPSFVS